MSAPDAVTADDLHAALDWAIARAAADAARLRALSATDDPFQPDDALRAAETRGRFAHSLRTLRANLTIRDTSPPTS